MRRNKKIFGSYYVNFKRDVHKSLRLDSRVYRYIMQIDGSDFADSLENLVIQHARLIGRSEELIH